MSTKPPGSHRPPDGDCVPAEPATARASDRADDAWDPRKPRYVVTLRRWKRRVRAVASIGLALAAGTFLAAQGRADSSAPKPKKPDVGREQPKPKDAAKDKNQDGGKSKDKDKDKGGSGGEKAKDSSAKEPAKDGSRSAGKEREQGKAKGEQRRPDQGKKVDREEHRKGMPVPDNLIE